MSKEWESFNEVLTGPAHYSTESGSIKAPEKPRPNVVVTRIEQPKDEGDARTMWDVLKSDPLAWDKLDELLPKKVDK